jgi:hypothetical protein
VGCVQLWSVDDAEEAREAQNARSLDEDAMGFLEVDVRSLIQMLKKENPKVRSDITLCLISMFL